MADSTKSTRASESVAASSTGIDASPATPAGFPSVRRAMTVDDGANAARWRPPSADFGKPRLSFDGGRRRNSTFSDYSLTEARRHLHDDVLNPGGAGLESHDGKWSWLPLVFALLPPLGGIFHKNGSAFMTDMMLLGLAAVFLNWSVTQPW